MKVVPAAFMDSPHVDKLLVDGMSGIMAKRLAQPSEDNERYLAAHALTFVLEGGLRVEDGEGNFATLNPGDFAFLPKGLYFISDLIPESGAFIAVVCFFGGQLLEDWADDLAAVQSDESSALLVLETPAAVGHFLGQVMDLYGGTGSFHGEVTQVKLRELLHWLGREGSGRSVAGRVAGLRSRMRRPLQAFMERNFAKPLAVEDYAYLSGRSPSTFHRDFKRVYGEGPKSWLRRRRLALARERLLSQGGNVSQVAASLGYGNPSHFIKIFREAYGESPKQLVLRLRNA